MRILCTFTVALLAALGGPTQQPSTDFQYTHPKIVDYGKVVPLPKAAQQPRHNSRIVVDITKGGSADQVNPALEKTARFVNIYAGAGKQAAEVKIAVILHGDATLAILNNKSYAKRFNTDSNPSLDCLKKLQSAGVKIYVCGQSLIGKHARPEQVHSTCEVAVSALTTLVNLQADGYAYVPLK